MRNTNQWILKLHFQFNFKVWVFNWDINFYSYRRKYIKKQKKHQIIYNLNQNCKTVFRLLWWKTFWFLQIIFLSNTFKWKFSTSIILFSQDFPVLVSPCFLPDYTIVFTWMEDGIFLCRLHSLILSHVIYFFLTREVLHPILSQPPDHFPCP